VLWRTLTVVATMEPAMKWVTKTIKFLSQAPPKQYNPSVYTWTNWMKKWQEEQLKHGFWRTYNKARMETLFRKGVLVGTDGNGNKYYEDKTAPTYRSRWVEYPTPPGVWAIEQRYDATMVSPEWHGWLHYVHDKTGTQLQAEFGKPFKQASPINQAMMRPEYSREGLDPPMEFAIHQPPGQRDAKVERGRIGPKYQSWSQSEQSANPKLRNYADNSKTLHIP